MHSIWWRHAIAVTSVRTHRLTSGLFLLLQYHDHEPAPGPLDLQVFDGADHFFEGRYDVSMIS